MFDDLDVSQRADRPAYLKIAEIAARYRFAPVTVWRWIKFGVKKCGMMRKLAATQFGWTYRVKAEDLDDFLRRINPETWRKLAEEQEEERKNGKRDQKRLQEMLDKGKRRRRPSA